MPSPTNVVKRLLSPPLGEPSRLATCATPLLPTLRISTTHPGTMVHSFELAGSVLPGNTTPKASFIGALLWTPCGCGRASADALRAAINNITTVAIQPSCRCFFGDIFHAE